VSPQPAPAPAAGGEPHWTDLDQDAIVLGLLLECADDFVSGAVLCDKLDVPRPELLKRIDSLRARGYGIEASGGRGYRLVEIPDKLNEQVIAPLLSTSEIGLKLHGFPVAESTNDEADRLAEMGAAHGEVVVAELQTKGRGRRGRSWIAPPGKSLTLSVILRPTLPPSRAPEITLAAALALCEAAHEMGAPGARVKWPNDIECRGQKLAGILAELRTEGDRFAAWLEALTPEFLAVSVTEPDGKTSKSRFERLLGAKEHEMHHRAQLMLIERQLGIVPHLTRQFQERVAQMRAAKA
jgi:biotin operon repressor